MKKHTLIFFKGLVQALLDVTAMCVRFASTGPSGSLCGRVGMQRRVFSSAVSTISAELCRQKEWLLTNTDMWDPIWPEACHAVSKQQPYFKNLGWWPDGTVEATCKPTGDIEKSMYNLYCTISVPVISERFPVLFI